MADPSETGKRLAMRGQTELEDIDRATRWLCMASDLDEKQAWQFQKMSAEWNVIHRGALCTVKSSNARSIHKGHGRWLNLSLSSGR